MSIARRSSRTMAALALGIFGIISTEIGVVGVLPDLADRAHVTVSQAGLLVSVFALVVAVTGPIGVLAVSRVNRKTVLLAALAMFALSNVVFALSSTFSVLLAFRVLPALMHPIFFAVALTTAARLAPTGRSADAAARVFAGVTVGFAFGVPALAFLAGQFSLESAFAAVAVVNVLSILAIARWVPSLSAERAVGYGDQLRILRRPALWRQLAAVTFIFAAMFATYSYFADYLRGVSHLGSAAVSTLLMVFGVVMIGGNFLFARLLRTGLTRTVVVFLGGYLVFCPVMYALGPIGWAMALLVIPWSLIHSGGLVIGQSMIAAESSDAPDLGNSLFVSTSNLGITLGSAVAGLQISAHGTRSIVAVGIVAAVIALLLGARRSRQVLPADTEPVSVG